MYYNLLVSNLSNHRWENIIFQLTHVEPMFPFETPYGFLMFSGSPKREHWLSMGEERS